jgi:hypothetical protein
MPPLRVHLHLSPVQMLMRRYEHLFAPDAATNGLAYFALDVSDVATRARTLLHSMGYAPAAYLAAHGPGVINTSQHTLGKGASVKGGTSLGSSSGNRAAPDRSGVGSLHSTGSVDGGGVQGITTASSSVIAGSQSLQAGGGHKLSAQAALLAAPQAATDTGQADMEPPPLDSSRVQQQEGEPALVKKVVEGGARSDSNSGRSTHHLRGDAARDDPGSVSRGGNSEEIPRKPWQGRGLACEPVPQRGMIGAVSASGSMPESRQVAAEG